MGSNPTLSAKIYSLFAADSRTFAVLLRRNFKRQGCFLFPALGVIAMPRNTVMA